MRLADLKADLAAHDGWSGEVAQKWAAVTGLPLAAGENAAIRVARRVAELFTECPNCQLVCPGDTPMRDCPTCWGTGAVVAKYEWWGDNQTINARSLARFLFGEEP